MPDILETADVADERLRAQVAWERFDEAVTDVLGYPDWRGRFTVTFEWDYTSGRKVRSIHIVETPRV